MSAFAPHKKMAETDLSKTEVGTRICCGGKAGGFSPWEAPFCCEKKDSTAETNLADRGSVVQKIGVGSFGGDFVKWQVCVQRWSLV